MSGVGYVGDTGGLAAFGDNEPKGMTPLGNLTTDLKDLKQGDLNGYEKVCGDVLKIGSSITDDSSSTERTNFANLSIACGQLHLGFNNPTSGAMKPFVQNMQDMITEMSKSPQGKTPEPLEGAGFITPQDGASRALTLAADNKPGFFMEEYMSTLGGLILGGHAKLFNEANAKINGEIMGWLGKGTPLPSDVSSFLSSVSQLPS
ncbi:MAG: hypothetical protein SP1CHLAM54_12110 [Chlamydiia bacterium]|nr:hypothetical protein [Chlamydiia bacterium]MCH9616109.1 hypothetical protein [Chlamydiia bacterium]MCH9629468.1 hypothetical protein [Chlamydiia bacterium]